MLLYHSQHLERFCPHQVHNLVCGESTFSHCYGLGYVTVTTIIEAIKAAYTKNNNYMYKINRKHITIFPELPWSWSIATSDRAILAVQYSVYK